MSWDHYQSTDFVRVSRQKIEKKVATECQTQISSYQLILPVMREKKRQYQQLRLRNANFKQQFLGDLLDFILSKRKRFCFQVMKQFYLFPDETYSQDLSINTYDGLLVPEEPIHTFVKIYQTKELQTIIWAFLNIKMLHLHQKLTTFIGNIQGVKTRIEKQQKISGFHFIREYSIKIKPPTKQKKRTHRIARTAEKNIRLNRPSLIKIEPIKMSHYSPTTKNIPSTDSMKIPTTPLKTEYNKMPTIKQVPTYTHQKPVHSNCVHIYGCCAINTYHHIHDGCGIYQPNNHCCEGMHQCPHSHYQNHNSYQKDLELRYNIEERIQYLRRLEELYEERGKTERK